MSERAPKRAILTSNRDPRVRCTHVGLDARGMAYRTAAATLTLNTLFAATGKLPSFDIPAGQQTVISRTHTPIQQSDNYLEKWALHFKEDPLAGETVNPLDATETVAQVKELIAKGVTIKNIRIQGWASDDDDTVNRQGQPTGGLGVSSKDNKNPALAYKRSTVFEQQLKDEFGVSVPDIQVLGGKEDILSHKQIAKIKQLAQKYHYGSVYDMIVDYNTALKDGAENLDARIPHEVKTKLDENLGDERYVAVTINGTLNNTKVEHVIKHKKIPGLYLVPIPGLLVQTTEAGGPGVITETVYQHPTPKVDSKGYPRQNNTQGHLRLRQPRPYNFTNSQRGNHSGRNHGGSLNRPS